MSVNLKVTLGTVNYTDWLHVTASKVSAPSVVVWEDWINVPVTNYNFVIPNLDPENYYVRYYDAATDVALGTLVAELIVNALTNEVLFERRFYTCGGSNPGDPDDGDNFIQDDYLIGKTIYGTYKRGLGPYEPDIETEFDESTGRIDILTGAVFEEDEKFVVEIKYIVPAVNSNVASGLYRGTIDAIDAAYTLLVDDANKRVRCLCSGTKQAITLPASTSLAIDDGYYIDNSVGGTPVQVKLLFTGSDKIRYNGFYITPGELAEFWVSVGEHVLIKKQSDGFFECIGDYAGINVGKIQSLGYEFHKDVIPEDGRLLDGDEYPRLYWWVKNILPANYKVETTSVTDGGYVHDVTRPGQFVIHPTLKKIRMPKTVGLVQKGLASFTAHGVDTANRAIDYPGGFQAEMVKAHSHTTKLWEDRKGGSSGNDVLSTTNNGHGSFDWPSSNNVGAQNRVDNNGVIFGRNI